MADKHAKMQEKHSSQSILCYGNEDLRWATNEMVARYRAGRLKCNVIADLGSGIGFQSFEFAKHCKKVLAVEIDQKKLEFAKRNAKALGIGNIEFIHGDCLDDDVIKKLGAVDIVFCDPERLPEEEERRISTIKPDPDALLAKYASLTNRIAIEFPPQIRCLPDNAEKEYVSVDGKLNRLTLYFGKLRTCSASAVSLPGKARLEQKSPAVSVEESIDVKRFFFEADPAIVKAGLLGLLAQETGTSLFSQDKHAYLTSEKKVRNPFFVSAFEVMSACPFTKESIVKALRKNGAGRVVIRYGISPKEYWGERKGFEEALQGKEKLCLFRFGEMAIIARKI